MMLNYEYFPFLDSFYANSLLMPVKEVYVDIQTDIVDIGHTPP